MRFEPWPALRPYVETITVNEVDPVPPTVREILPRRNLALGFQYGERLKVIRDGVEQTLFESGLTGLQTSVRFAPRPGRSKYVLIYLKPGSAAAFLPGSMAEFLDLHVDLRSVIHTSEVSTTLQLVQESSSQGERVQAVQEFLLRPLKPHAVDSLMKFAVARLEESNGNLSIETLARSLFISQRQLERRFKYSVGMSPKRFALMLRFAQSLRLYPKGRRTDDIALACGYFDQAHFTRAFRKVTGLPPMSYFSRQECQLLED